VLQKWLPVVGLQPAGLPDDIFSSQKSRFGLILDGLATEDIGRIGMYIDNLLYFMAIWYILW
jgi:hypothetical protein